MMKFILIVLLFFAAVAISPFLIGEKGYILIAMGDLTVESTVVTASIFLVVLFVTLLVVLKVLRGGVKLGTGTWHKITFASKKRSEREYRKGIAAYLLADYEQAEYLLAKCADGCQYPLTAYLVAAQAAQAQGDNNKAAYYLQLAEHQEQSSTGKAVKENGLESVLVQLNIFKQQQEWQKARALLDTYHAHIGHDYRLLALEIDVSLIEKRFDHALAFIAKAKKQKQISQAQISTWESAAYYGQFTNTIEQKSNQELAEQWQSLPRKVKQNTNVIAAYCKVLTEHQIIEPLNKLLQPVFKKGQQTELINQVKTLSIPKPTELIALVQNKLQSDQQNSFWLSCLGHLALADQQWPLAERAFHSLLAHSEQTLTTSDAKGYAIALNQQGKYQQAAELLVRL